MVQPKRFLPFALVLCFLTNLACIRDIYVEKPNTISFQETLQIESEMAARVAAHVIPARVRGNAPSSGGSRYLEPMRLPEAFNSTGLQSTKAHEFHLGYAAARLIRQYYAALHPNGLRIESDKLIDIVNAAGGNIDSIYEPNREWPIEIADIEKRLVFEVVPPGESHRVYGNKKASLHAMLVNQTLFKRPQFELGKGFSGEIGVRFAEKTAPWKLSFETVEPGVIAYRWFVLSAAKATDEAHQEAYANDQWHEPTPQESSRLGRSLHLVVERLVLAREALGQAQARKEMPMLPSQTMGEYLRALSLWSAHDERIARLLPIMRRPPVRPDPRLLAQTPDGAGPKMHPGATKPDDMVVPPHPSAPEAYTMDGTFGKMPFEFFLGYSAHRAIAYRYEAYRRQVGHTVYKNFISVGTIVEKTGGKRDLLPWAEADLRPDIAHVRGNESENFVFEIKPEGAVHLAKGKEKLAQYIAALNLGMVGTSKVFVPGPDESGELYIMFKRGRRVWRLSWRSTAPGLVQYKWDRPNTKLDEEDERLREEAWRDAIKNGRWTDISRQEMADDAEDLFTDLEGMVLRRDILGLFRDAVTVAVEGVGIAAEAALSARLWNHIDKTTPRIVPIIRAPAPGTQPIPKSKPIPSVNARSLGSDKRMTPNQPRPLAPRKTPANVAPN